MRKVDSGFIAIAYVSHPMFSPASLVFTMTSSIDERMTSSLTAVIVKKEKIKRKDGIRGGKILFRLKPS